MHDHRNGHALGAAPAHGIDQAPRPPAGLLIGVYIFAVALSLGLVVYGWSASREAFAAVGFLGLVVTAAVAPLSFVLPGRGAAPRDERLGEQLAALALAVERLGEQNALSDDARRVLNRTRERELLRRAIEEDIASEDWDAGLVLCRELADRFGYRADAEEFRARIDRARHETVERRVNEAVARLDALIIARRWNEAIVEAARVQRLYPDSPRVETLKRRVEQARAMYKADLERRFLLAAQDNHVDEAMALLPELDMYLTEQEAEPFRELARGVIGKAKENLGVQFKLAVQDRQWRRAADIGEQIIASFPNTRMAHEVRGLLDNIRARASAIPAHA